MAAEVLDLQHLSAYCSLPREIITTLLDAPTVDLVRTLLQNVAHKAREHEEASSEILRLSVELENAVRGGESKARILKSSIDKGLKDAAELRQKLQSEGLYISARNCACGLTLARTNKSKFKRRIRNPENLHLIIDRGSQQSPGSYFGPRVIQPRCCLYA